MNITKLKRFFGVAFCLGAISLGISTLSTSVMATDDQTPILKRTLLSIVQNAKIDEKTKVGVYVKVLENGKVVFSSDGNTYSDET